MSYVAGFIGLLGYPNAGKSTLVNALVGEKVGIVTAKPQTTRQKVLGLLNHKDGQAVFVDTPGLISPKKGLNQFLHDELNEVLRDVDMLLVVVPLDLKDPQKIPMLFEKAKEVGKPWVVVVTKMDLPPVHRVQHIRGLASEYDVPVITTSKTWSQSELQDVTLKHIFSSLPVSPGPLYDQELYTTQSWRELAAEIIRESCFEFLHQEVPYGLAVRLRQFNEGPHLEIYADIVLAKENHRAIVIGQKGQSLKKIGSQARMEIQKIYGKKVYLNLHVTVQKDWQSQEKGLKEMGYVLNQ